MTDLMRNCEMCGLRASSADIRSPIERHEDDRDEIPGPTFERMARTIEAYEGADDPMCGPCYGEGWLASVIADEEWRRGNF